MPGSNSENSRWRNLFPLAIAALALIADQISKYIVTTNLHLYQEWSPIPALEWLFSITYITNTGAAFGIFPQASTIFTIIPVVVAVVIFIYSRQLPSNQWLLRFSLGLQLGGALGNLIDRLIRGYVVDMLYFKFWPVFNVADSCIFVGVVLMSFYLLRENPFEEKATQEIASENSEQNISAAS